MTAVRADADPPPPPAFSLAARETIDVWDILAGGVRTGPVILNKLQISATVVGDAYGMPGWSVHAQVFRTDGASLSSRVGDIQTVSNIEAVPTFRLFESWVEKKFGDDRSSFAVRAGLMDLNSDFDSVQAASLFINSSHGIAPDLSRSGRNGPSIFPVSSAGLRASWLPSKRWTWRLAAFDGVPGDPDHPKVFVKVRLRREDGALLIAQTDYHLSDEAKVEVGAWRYSAASLPVWPGAARLAHDQGVYGSIEGPLPLMKGLSGWVRVGAANPNAQIVEAYAGAGFLVQGLITGRKDDRFGFAIANAVIGNAARAALHLPRQETTVEASYQYKLHDTLAVQPDLQFVRHPAGIAGARNALVLGLRLVLTAGYPRRAPATEAADPTVPPDGPQPDGSPQRPR